MNPAVRKMRDTELILCSNGLSSERLSELICWKSSYSGILGCEGCSTSGQVDQAPVPILYVDISDRDRDMLARRFGLGMSSGCSIKAIAELYGMSSERARVLTNRALWKVARCAKRLDAQTNGARAGLVSGISEASGPEIQTNGPDETVVQFGQAA